MLENSKYGQAHGKQFQGLTERAQIALSHYDWPGNVRELENVISSAAISASGAFIDVGDLPVHLRKPPQGEPLGLPTGARCRSRKCAESTSSGCWKHARAIRSEPLSCSASDARASIAS